MRGAATAAPAIAGSDSSGDATAATAAGPRAGFGGSVGELLMGDTGLFGVICFCHSSHMSVAKFCEHSGSPSANPGEAVYLENGMSISHWCKQCLGIMAPDDVSGWEWSGGSSTKSVLVGSKASNAPTLLNNIGAINNVKAFGGSWRSAEPLNNLVPNHPYTKVGHTAQEKSVNKEQDNGYQRYNLDGRNLFQEKLPSSVQVSMPALTKNQSMQAVKQSPNCVSPEKAHSTLCKEEEIVDQHLNTYGVNYSGKCADHYASLPCLWANKSVSHDCDVSSSNFSIEASLADRDGASNIELRLGQPSQKYHTFAGSFPTSVLEFGATCNSEKPQLHQQLKQQIGNAWDTKKTRQNLHCTPSEASCSNKRLVQHATRTVNAVNHSESEDLTRDANKNPLISLFLSHLEGSSTSLSLDNLFNNSDQFPSRMPSADSPIKPNVSNSVGGATHGVERKSDASKLDFSNNLDERKSLLAVDNSIVRSDCMVKNNQAADAREPATSFTIKCCQSSVFGDGTQSSFFLDQPSGMLQKLGVKNSKQHDKASFLSNKDCCDHVIHGSSVPIPYESVGPDSLNADIPVSLSSTTLGSLEPNTKVFSTTQHLMDVNLTNFAFRHMVELSTQENSTASLKTSPQHHKLCCLSSMESQHDGCQDDLVMRRDAREGTFCRSHHDVSKNSIRSVYSCPSCQSGCGMDFFASHPCHTGSTRSCNCTGSTQRVPLNPEKHCKRFSTCCICDVDEQPCLRLGRMANNCFAGSLKHEMCNHKEHNSCLSGHCCSSVLSCCVSGFCTSGGNNTSNALSERRVCGQAKAMHATPDHDKDYLLPDCKRIRLAHCDCSKNNVVLRNDQQTTFWRDVPKKVFAHADVSSTDKFAQALETTKNVGDQLADCVVKFDGAHQNSQSMRAQQMSNMSSGSSAPVVTEVSIEANNLTCTANIKTTNMIHDFLVDEGSGNEKCGSSDEAVGGTECDEALHLMGKADATKSGFHCLAGHLSVDLIDELRLKNPFKTKRVKNINEECSAQENINQKQKFERTHKAANKNESMERNKADALIPLLDFSAVPSEIPNNIGHLEINSSRSQGIEVSPQPGSVMQRTHVSSCGSSSVKRKRSALSFNKSNFFERFGTPHKLPEDDEKQSLDEDCSLRSLETSRKKTKQDLAACSKQENSMNTGKPPKYMSLNCIGNTPNNDKTSLPKKNKPVVCGNSGIISCGGTVGDQKPPKIVSLSLILRKARRCNTTEICNTGMSQDNESSSWKLLHEKDVLNDFSENGQNHKIHNRSGKSEECSSKNSGYLDASSIGKETDSGNNRNLGPGLHPKQLMSQSRPKHKDVRTRSLSKLAAKHRHATKGTCLSTSGINECSKLIEAKNQLNDSPSTTVGVEHQDKKLQHPRELSGSALPRNIGSFAYPKINQDHAGKLSQVSRRRCSRGFKSPSFLLNSDAFCCVCGSSNQEDANTLLECNDCLIRVHQACYGVSKVPKGHWYCRPCKSNSHNIVCVLCGYGSGAMTRALKSQNIVKSLLKAWKVGKGSYSVKSDPSENTENELFNLSSVDEASKLDKCALVPSLGEIIFDVFPGATLKLDLQKQTNITESKNGMPQAHNSIIAGVLDPSITQWVHMVCGLWTPGTRCPNVDTMSTFDVSGALPAKKNIVCSMCNRPGGSCIECRVPSCSVPFHPWCGHQKGLLQSEIEGDDNEKVGFYGRCLRHATLNSFHVDSHVTDPEEESPRNKDWTCARTEGFRGRKREKGHQPNPQRPYKDGGVCIVSQEQINAWLHINGQKSCTRGVVKPQCSDVEYDFRKEYIRYKQSKGWKHLVVYKSGIHALGLYTSQFIARGAMVVEYVGEIVGLRVADKREAEYQSGRRIQYKSACYFFRIDKEHIIDATRKGGIARFVNHSCLPNCVAKVISVRNEKKVVFFAERDINPGEEITYDYHFNCEDEGKKIPCFCSSRNCRRYLN